jgi:hypothetical protein
MKKERQQPGTPGRFGGESEYKNEHERRKQSWSEAERKSRKERRHPEAAEQDEAAAAPFRGDLPL